MKEFNKTWKNLQKNLQKYKKNIKRNLTSSLPLRIMSRRAKKRHVLFVRFIIYNILTLFLIQEVKKNAYI